MMNELPQFYIKTGSFRIALTALVSNVTLRGPQSSHFEFSRFKSKLPICPKPAALQSSLIGKGSSILQSLWPKKLESDLTALSHTHTQLLGNRVGSDFKTHPESDHFPPPPLLPFGAPVSPLLRTPPWHPAALGIKSQTLSSPYMICPLPSSDSLPIILSLEPCTLGPASICTPASGPLHLSSLLLGHSSPRWSHGSFPCLFRGLLKHCLAII